MKKSFLLFSLFSLFAYYGNCQDTLKATASRISSELNLNPLNGSFSLNNANAQIKIRKFISDHNALRVAFTTTYIQNDNSDKSNYGYEPLKRSTFQKSLTAALSIGLEKHFKGTRRISPYIGWEIGFGLKSSKQIDKSGDYKRTIEGTWMSEELYYLNNYGYLVRTSFEERGYWNLSGNIVAGVDIYIAKDFYLGVEVAYGLDYFKYNQIDITSNQSSGETYPDNDSEKWSFGPKIMNGIRIGFVF